MPLSRRTVAATVVAVSVALGGGLALASPEDPTTEEVTVTDDGDGVVADTTGDGSQDGIEEGGEEGGEDGTEAGDEGADEGTEGEHPDNHGALVSEAAHNHDFDEACGNHGTYVSHIARTGEPPACATETAGGDDTGSVEETAVASSSEPAKKAPKAAAGKGGAKGGNGRRSR